jgi:hypothetical protein
LDRFVAGFKEAEVAVINEEFAALRKVVGSTRRIR